MSISFYQQQKNIQQLLGMRRQEPTQIKLLHKKFHFLNKNDIMVIYDFLQQDQVKTMKILTILRDIKNPHSIIKTLLERPQKGLSLLASFQKRYDEIYNQEKVVSGNKKYDSQAKFNFFYYIPKDLLLLISLFLDPYSIANFSMTSSKILKLQKSQAFDLYYKNLCVNLFQKFEARMPEPCRFIQVRNYVMKQNNLFGPNSRNAVRNNLRYYVWQRQTKIQKYPKAYLLSFGNYRNLYFKLPRINFNGLYVCKHQYRKQQQKNLINNTTQVYYITHFRYFRFIQDGTIVSAFFTTKQKLNEVAQLLSLKILEVQGNKMEKNIMIGQFLQTGNQVEVKLFKQGAIFTYNLELAKDQIFNKKQISNQLKVLKYILKVVDEKQIVQTLQQHDSKNPIYFKYCFNSTIAKDNSSIIRSSSL